MIAHGCSASVPYIMKIRIGVSLLLVLCVACLIEMQAQVTAQSLGTQQRNASSDSDRMPISGPIGQASKASRLIVKLRPEFAGGVEAALPDDMVLTIGAATSQELRQFMGRYSARSIAPLYSGIVRAKKLRQISGREFAITIREKFRTRARRLETTFNPPDISRTYLLQVSVAPQELSRILARLKADARVEYAEFDDAVSITYTPNDPYFSSSGSWGQTFEDLWGIKRVNAPAAWDTTYGQGITVAVVDTGLDTTHPDIATNLWTNSGEIKSNGIDDDANGFTDEANGLNFVSSNN